MFQLVKNRIRETRKEENSFTLIELLIVIAILNILSAIVVFSVNNITDRGQTSACKAEKQTLLTAKEALLAQDNVVTNADTDYLRDTAHLLDSTPKWYSITDSVVNPTADGTTAGCA